MEYKASLDPLAKIITIAILIVLLSMGINSLRSLFTTQENTITFFTHLGIIILTVVVLLGSWLYSTQSYTLDSKELTINKPIGKTKIKLSDIKQVRTLANSETLGSIRTFGVGGLFGYFGKFYVPSIGLATYYTTQLKNKILIITNSNKKIVITPNDTSLIEKLKV